MNAVARLVSREGLTLVTFQHFLDAGLVRHGITTRFGGVSPEPLNTLNMGRRTADDPTNTEENRSRVARALGVPLGSFVYSDQVHQTEISRVTQANQDDERTSIDGLATDSSGLTLMTLYADCMGVLLYDPVQKAIGMAHAGWRGTVGEIGPKLVESMGQWFGSRPEDLLVGLGPAIGPCCFEIGSECSDAFEALADRKGISSGIIREGNVRADLWAVNRQLLEYCGVRSEAIAEARWCTSCHPELFFSHRRDHGQTGRMAAVMAL